MAFGLKNAPATFQRMVQEIFEDYLLIFMQVFLDDFSGFGSRELHLEHLEKCLTRCREARLCLNPMKCAFAVGSSMLLGCIVSAEGIAMDPAKVEAIRKAEVPMNSKQLGRFLG